MTAMLPASAIDAPLAEAGNPLPAPADSQINTLLRALTASWRPVSISVERRREVRRPCDLPAVLVPVDKQGRVVGGASLDVRVMDVSAHGIGICHPTPMPHKMVLLAFETESDGPVRLIVRLKWCRFKRTDLYESGGQILRVLNPDDEPVWPRRH
jgi:hypothetical protein